MIDDFINIFLIFAIDIKVSTKKYIYNGPRRVLIARQIAANDRIAVGP